MLTPSNPELLNPIQTAEFLGGMSPDTLAVWRCTKRYDLPYIRIGNRIFYDKADLLAFLESRKVGGK